MEGEAKPIKCRLCGERKVRQQSWKDAFEREHCITCIALLKYIGDLETALNDLVATQNIRRRRVRIFLDERTPESNLLEAIGLRPRYKPLRHDEGGKKVEKSKNKPK